MANIKSAQKRIKTSEKRRQKNVSIKTAIRSSAKKVIKAVETPGSMEPAALTAVFTDFVSKIDKAASKSTVHWKTAARKKSRLAKKVNKTVAAK
ncbi:MAG: 30S ribosomal protein S20 [Spirochaetes bacterium]|nr:MAG: 30S ribosomal protein S20 [Spirochaetota bacterium]